MNPAKLNHRINILYDVNGEAAMPITDYNGTPVQNWQEYKALWCEKEGLGGKGVKLPRLIYASNMQNSVITGAFLVRYREDITPQMKVQDGKDIYIIKDTPDLDGTRKYMLIIGEKVESVAS